MLFDRALMIYDKEDVFYNGIKLSITRQNIQDYTLQTGMPGESIVIFYYKKELQQIRDKQLEQLLNERNSE